MKSRARSRGRTSPLAGLLCSPSLSPSLPFSANYAMNIYTRVSIAEVSFSSRNKLILIETSFFLAESNPGA